MKQSVVEHGFGWRNRSFGLVLSEAVPVAGAVKAVFPTNDRLKCGLLVENHTNSLIGKASGVGA
jgi:hypothetical protein